MSSKKLVVGVIMCSLLVLSLVSAEVVKIRPNSQGNHKQWDNVNCPGGLGEWQCVDEVDLNNTDRVETAEDNRKETFNFQDTGFTTETINFIRLVYNGKQIDDNSKCFEPLIKINGSNYRLKDDLVCMNSTPEKYRVRVNNSPATGSPWTIAEVEALEAGMHTGNVSSGGKVTRMFVNVNYDAQTCGNNIREGTEVCDGTDLDGETCTSQGFDGGTLVCNSGCDGFDTSACFTNSCTDSDGGDEPFTFGYVSGEESGSPFNNSDVCINSTFLTEWTCSGDAPSSSAVDCDALTIFPAICFNGFCVETS